MKKNVNLPNSLPIFPLPGALLLPNSKLPLHIFEPKYLAMIDEVLQNSSRLIGMLQTKQTSDESNEDNLYNIGLNNDLKCCQLSLYITIDRSTATN